MGIIPLNKTIAARKLRYRCVATGCSDTGSAQEQSHRS